MSEQSEMEEAIDDAAPTDDDVSEPNEAVDQVPIAEDASTPVDAVAEDQEPKDTNLVKHLRSLLNEANKKLRQAEAERPQVAEVPKPTLESCGFDEDQFTDALLKWNENQAKIKESKRGEIERAEMAQKRFATQAQKYQAEISKIDGGKEAQDIVEAFTDTNQQAIIVMHADNPAEFIAHASKNEALLMQINAAKDPLDLVKLITKAEMNMKKTTPTKPAPEGGISRASTPAAPKNLDAAIQKAQESGRYEDALALIRQQRAKERLQAAKK